MTYRAFVTAACAATLILPSAVMAQQDTTRRDTTSRRDTTARGTPVTSQQRLRVQKRGEASGTLDIRADSIAAAERERARMDSISAAARADSIARVERMRADSIAAVERARADSIARVEAARRDSIARADSIAAEQERYRQYMARYRFGGNGWYMGLAAGASAPTGNFQNLGYNSGLNVNVPIGWHRENSFLGVRLDLGYNRFSGQNFLGNNNGTPVTLTNTNPQVFSASLNLTAALPFTPIRNVSLYGVGGGGLYHFRDIGRQSALGGFLGNDVLTENEGPGTNQATISKVGANIGAGLDWTVGTSSVFLESRLVHVFADQGDNVALNDFFGDNRANGLRWVPITIGVKIR